MTTARPARTGAVGLAVLTTLLVAVFFLEDIPLIGGRNHTAHFTEAAGLSPGDEVRIAGVKAGSVTAMELEGDHVRVDFRVPDAWLGDRTTASIEIKTLLGQKYLALDPLGESELDGPIPASRTRSPYDINDAFSGLAGAVEQIDTARLAQSFEVMSQTFAGSPRHVGEALRGLSALSRTIASRDESLGRLLGNARQISGTLAARDGELRRLLADGNALLEEIRFRKDAISALLAGVSRLSEEVRGVVADNSAQLRPALDSLGRITAILRQNQENLDRGLQRLAPFARLFTNMLGNGRWFDAYVCGLLPPTVETGFGSMNPQGCEPPVAGQIGAPG
ncbi:MCE family protein [Saccharopolyspora taberi]|uniref:MCE family protein n=1 Tax=Saccharopolyspora taberi TaxID=60895 RepID=A0ABN3V243_9PSEU